MADSVCIDRGTMGSGDNFRTDALRVPGGTLYRTIVSSEHSYGSSAVSVHSSMVFVPEKAEG